MKTRITDAQREVLQTRNHRGKLLIPSVKEGHLSPEQIAAVQSCLRHKWIGWIDRVASHPAAAARGIHGPINVYMLTKSGYLVCDEHKIPFTD